MKPGTFRLWAIEHLALWPNRLHVLLAVLVPIVVVSSSWELGFSWFELVLAVTAVGSFVFRVWRWDQRRFDGSGDSGSEQPAVRVESTP